ncbi:hypothetical protein [Acinetobacter bereziniae]|nr:hypothetical protein [Acinetobacter bereziniae]MDV8156738.1 hypothetical protein [Acinetobacter bereziniae]
MALIETTDSFFVDATKDLSSNSITEFKIIERLDSIFLSKVELQSYNQKSCLIVFDTFEYLIDENTIDKIINTLDEHSYLINRIKTNYTILNLYQQSYILFVYWMLENKKHLIVNEWPLDKKILQYLATDIGVSLIN